MLSLLGFGNEKLFVRYFVYTESRGFIELTAKREI